MTIPDSISNKAKDRLLSLIEFSRQTVGSRTNRPSSISEHGLLEVHEHSLIGLPGIRINGGDQEDEVWLKVERLHEIGPPLVEDRLLLPWIDLDDDPNKEPHLKDVIDGASLIEAGTHRSSIAPPDDDLPEVNPDESVAMSEFDLADLVKSGFDVYLATIWLPWAEEERLRRTTIGIYDKLYQIERQIEVTISEAQLELVWGIGIGIWNHQGTSIKYPILGQLVELSMDSDTSEINIRPRVVDPGLEVDWATENNPGVGDLNQAKKEFFDNSEMSFSPFEPSTFETVLRSAVTNLDSNGIYWPESASAEDRSLPVADDRLKVTDTWVIFARPRSNNLLLQDLERLKGQIEEFDHYPAAVSAIVKDPETSNPVIELPSFRGVTASYRYGNDGPHENERELYFPKPFNDEQIRIVQMLEISDGVVVQGPPGTGKTHTIANVICHYLAQGKRVLVTSMKDPALAVLQKQLPEEIRPLAISLLTSERDGMKQFEFAIRKIADEVQGRDRNNTIRDIGNLEESIDGLHGQLAILDRKIQEVATNNLTNIVIDSEEIEPHEAAKELVTAAEEFEWIPDPLGIGAEFVPQFSNEDVVLLRDERRVLGNDISYLDASLPQASQFPDPAVLLQAHQDLSRFEQLTREVEIGNVPPLADSSKKVLTLAQQLLDHTESVRLERTALTTAGRRWIAPVTERLKQGISREDSRIRVIDNLLDMFEALGSDLAKAIERRRPFLDRPVTVPASFELDTECVVAVKKLSAGEKPFGLRSLLGKTTQKQLINAVRIVGNKPANPDDWKHVARYVTLLEDTQALVLRWNALAPELQFDEVKDPALESSRAAASEYDLYIKLKALVKTESEITNLVPRVFPNWADVHEIVSQGAHLAELENALRHHVTRGHLADAWAVKERLQAILVGHSGKIIDDIRNFSGEILGNEQITDSRVQAEWSALMEELGRIRGLSTRLSNVLAICEKIECSGAPEYSKLLKQPVDTTVDKLLPNNWYQSWRLRRLATYLDSTDAHFVLKDLVDRRIQIEKDLSGAYGDLVVQRTWLALMENASPSVRQALTAFLTAIQRIGGGTGKRAMRYRRDARIAADQANHAVPCWIMPHYRVSESLPSELGVFDLVIIDEASQSDLNALPSLLRAEKVLVVGDDEQVQPEGVGLSEDYILNLRKTFLRDQVPIYGQQMTPERSIYDLFRVVFSTGQVTLKEHFRCVPSIIEYSKREFYNHELRPLRLPKASERLDPPLVDVLVEDGYRHADENRPEARFIVDEIKKIVADPSMAGRSIGVVSLLGATQAGYIWRLLTHEIGLDLIERHQITSGDARMFQGKERDIMFLTMVVAPNEGSIAPITRKTFERSFNVAASRARDRMYLVRSVNPDDLSEADRLRRSLIKHFDAPFAQDEFRVEDLRTLCESDFEREVYDELTQRGYSVTPQVKVGPYRIDLVVEGEDDTRLAIECDGDRYHGPEKWADDMQREANLRRAGWPPFWRCFASEFVRHRTAMMDDLLQTLSDRGIEPTGAEQAGRSMFVEHRVVISTIADQPYLDAIGLDNNGEDFNEASESPAESDLILTKTDSAGLDTFHEAEIPQPLTEESDGGSLDEEEGREHPDTDIQSTAKAPAVGRLTVAQARNELIDYRERVISKSHPLSPRDRGLLRNNMLDRLLTSRPTTPEQFQILIPETFREQTEKVQIDRHLGHVLEVILQISEPDLL